MGNEHVESVPKSCSKSCLIDALQKNIRKTKIYIKNVVKRKKKKEKLVVGNKRLDLLNDKSLGDSS